MFSLRWEPRSHNKKGEAVEFDLLAGSNPAPLAWLQKKAKLWEATIWLPRCSPKRQYDTLERQQEAVELAVQRWFEAAGSDPAERAAA